MLALVVLSLKVSPLRFSGATPHNGGMYTIENNFHKNNSTLDYKRPAYLSRRKQKLYNRAKGTHKTRNWNSYHAIKKLAQKKCREAYSSYINNIICSEEASPKLFWNYIKNKKNDRCGVAPLKRPSLQSTQVFCNPGLSYSCGSCFRWYTFLHYISALGLEVIPQSVNVGVNCELFQYVV
jgi:hypothetical protein